MPQKDNDQATDMPVGIRATVEEAAKYLGLSENAVRKRIERGTLKSEKVDEVRYVLLDNELPQHADNMPNSMPNSMPSDIVLIQAHLDSMQEQISYLKTVIQTRDEEIRRKDHLLAAALERLPELQAPQDMPSEPRGWPPSASDEAADMDVAPNGERPSWWRRWFSLG